MAEPAPAVDYQPLAGMQHAFKAVFRASFKDWRGIAMVVVAVAATAAGLFFGIFLLAVVGIGSYLAFLMQRSVVYKNGVWEQFAAANGWPLDTDTPAEQLVPPSMQFGHDAHFSPVIRAQLGNTGCDLFSYNTTVGSGRYQHTYYYTVALLPLPRALPHMLLLSKKAGAELQRDLADKQDLALEGDFDDYFKLQIEKGQQIDALTVITPDVMQTLVQYNRAEDIEILNDSLYFIMNFDRRGAAGMQQFVQSVVELGDQIIQNISLEHGPAAEAPDTAPAETAASGGNLV